MLDGIELHADYDEDADILYLWVNGPQASVSYETAEGHLVELDPLTRELVGVTILDYQTAWEGQTITLEVPQFEQRVLQPA